MNTSGYTFVLGNWRNDAAIIRALREPVLMDELDMPAELLELPDEDAACHILVYDSGGRAVGTARMRADGRIDYVVVLRPWRGRTVGGAMLSYLHHIAFVRGLGQMWGMVPESARRFFEKNRFVAAADLADRADAGRRKFVRAVSRPGEQISVH